MAPIWQSDRYDGDMGGSESEPTDARRSFFARIGIAHEQCWLNSQVHGRAITIIEKQRETHARREADGLITAERGCSLAVTVADCLPLFLAAPSAGVRGILHSGRRSTGIVVEAITLLRDRFSVAPSDIHLYIGVGIGGCCYQVSYEVWEEFGETMRRYSPYTHDALISRGVLKKDATHYALDLRAANILLARQWGLVHIDYDTRCSCCDHSFFSYRREGKKDYGHSIAVIAEHTRHPSTHTH